MKYHFTLFLFALLILAGCSQNGPSKLNKQDTQNKTVTFDEPKALELDSIQVAPVLLEEQKVITAGNYLITLGIRRDTLFRVFSLDDYKYLGAFGNIGKGPSEYNYPSLSGFSANGSDCILPDQAIVRTVRIDVQPNSTIQQVELSRFRIPGEFLPFNYAMIINDTLIAGLIDINSEKELVWFNPKSGSTGYIFDYPQLMDNVPPGAYTHLYTKSIGLSSDKGTLAFAYDWFPCIKIIDLKKNRSTLLKIETGFTQNLHPNFTPQTVNIFDLIKFYERICVTNHYVATFMNIQKLIPDEKNGATFNYLSNPEIQLFTTDGKPVARIVVKDWMNNFTLDEEHKRIIFINPLVENYIYYFDLGKVLTD